MVEYVPQRYQHTDQSNYKTQKIQLRLVKKIPTVIVYWDHVQLVEKGEKGEKRFRIILKKQLQRCQKNRKKSMERLNKR